MDKDSSVASPHEDGAGEKLVDEKNGHNSKGIEVKYATPTSQNGDAKIDIENLKSAFAGMGKEELMKFANDPFWVRIRWFLFILFWLLWLAMLGGAIAIIVLAPKCAPPTPREWWEQSPVYKADVSSFGKDSGKPQGDIKGLVPKLKYLEKLGVKTVVISNILGEADSSEDDEFKKIAPTFGTMDDFKSLISSAKNEDIKILLTLVPNHSTLKNPFFNKSVDKNSQYSSFYIWAPAKGYDMEGNPNPPNNWLSKTGGSAWEWNDQRKEFYLHQFSKDEPEFNFHNTEVVKYFDDVMNFWLDLGVSGFYLDRTPYLFEDRDFKNETFAREMSGDFTDYEFYDHSHTMDLPELKPLLLSWKQLAASKSGITIVDKVNLPANQSIAHLNIRSQNLIDSSKLTAEDVKTLIQKTLAANSWPTWQVKVKGEEEGSPLSQAMLLSTMLLPGVPVITAGQELGVNNLQQLPVDKMDHLANETKEDEKHASSMVSAVKKLLKERTSASILHGSIDMSVFNGTGVFAYTRIKSGNPGHLVVLNIGKKETSVDLRQLHSVPDDLTLLVSSNFSSVPDKKSVEATVSLPGRTVNVYVFVPLEKE